MDKLLSKLHITTTKSKNNVTSRQSHGFIYEDSIIKKYNLIKSYNSTSKFDAFTKKFIPVQIKCIKNGSSIDLGDLKRNQNINTNFILIIGFWKNTKYNIINEYTIYIDHIIYTKLCHFPEIDNFILDLKNISNNKNDDTKWKQMTSKYKLLYPKENLIKIRPKRDHKKQKRIQCSLNYKDFINKFLCQFKVKDLN